MSFFRRKAVGTTVRALVLGAGYGTRLRPLTLARPKPLVSVAGRSILAWTLSELENIGCEAVAINLHHLPEQIPEALGTRFGTMRLVYSHEPEILGTLGALAPLADFLAGADLVVVINGDSLCRWPLARLIRKHKKSGAESTLLTSRFADPARYGGGVSVDKDGRLLAFRGPHDGAHLRLVFAGAHVFSPALVRGLEPQPGDIVRDLYEPMLAAGRVISSLATRRPWFDLGTPKRYLCGAIDWSCGRGPNRWLQRNWPRKLSAEGSKLLRVAAEPSATVAPGCRVERSLVLSGASIGEGSQVRDSIIGFGVQLPPGTSVESRMITVHQTGVPLGAGDSVLGGLVYTPIREESG